MNEVSYEAALTAGIDPIHYRADRLQSLGPGRFPAQLDALVWAKRQPCLAALIQLDTGVKIAIMGFQKHSFKGLPEYLGFRTFTPGQRVALVVDQGVRGGLRPSLVAL